MATPAAAHCHIYSRWYYPHPQRCFTALAPLPQKSVKPASRIPETSRERIEIPLPALDWDICPDGDERLMGIAKLRALGMLRE